MRTLTPATLINHDLGVTGDEAMDLIFAVRREFDIDISDFPWSNYFSGERDLPNLVAIFAYWLRGGPSPRKKGLSVQALADYVASKS
ncbi:MAG: DUF1493 family protein [Bauldia sp.]|nr:DUF1493 family protein [Bauldia sp.]